MIFKQHELVVSGRKTQTRRLWKLNYAMSFSNGQIQAIYNTLTGRPLFELGQRLPVIPKRTYPAIRIGDEMVRVNITALRREPLQDISEADAFGEGVHSIEAYRALWESINGKSKLARWTANPSVLVIGFMRTPEVLRTLALQEALF